jgi:hypothetical protein
MENMILWNIGIVCFIIELHQFTSSGTPYIPQKRKQNLQMWSLYHSRDRIVAASRPLQIYTESVNHIGAVLSSIKGKVFICYQREMFMHVIKRKFCVESFWFLTIVILFVFVFFSFTPALKALYLQKFPFFPLKIRVKSSFSPTSFWKERMSAV